MAALGAEPREGRAGKVGFAAKPTVKSANGKTAISFAVNSSCDVQVEVVNAAGKVVRHLGGGVLGENSPLPFGKGLSQEVVWDGQDDFGKPAAGGPFTVRVGLGLVAEFDRVLGWSGGILDDVRGLTCGPDGTLYLIYGGQLYAHRRTTLISAFSRDGKYLRQVLPGPGGMPPEKRKGWPLAKLDDGREVPVVWHILSRSINPGQVLGDRCFPTVAPDGRLMVLNSPHAGCKITHPDLHGGRRLLILNPDGSVPENYLGPEVSKDQPAGKGWTAISPDGKYAYVSGLGGGKKKKVVLPPHHVVYRLSMSGGKPAEVFAGRLKQAGSGKGGLKDPAGVATDKNGNVYVADHGNNRIAVFDKSGKHLKDIAVKAPWQVLVSRRTGAIYVVAENGTKLVKLGGLGDPAMKASLSTPGFKKCKLGHNTMIALDDSQPQHVIWLVTRWWRLHSLHRLVDAGTSFKDEGDVIRKNTGDGINFTGGLAVLAGKLVTRTAEFGINSGARQVAFDVNTGKMLGTGLARKRGVFKGKLRANEVVTGKDGKLYTISSGFKAPHSVNRFDASFKELPFAAGNPLKGFWNGHTRAGGMFADRRGNAYLVGGDAYRKHETATVRKYGPDGKLVEKNVVKLGAVYYGGLAVDSRDNVYVGAQVIEKDKPIPDWFAGKLPKDNTQHRPGRCYRQYGAVVKFKPSGGAVVKDPAGEHYGVLAYSNRGPVSLKNAEWLRRGGIVPMRGIRGVDIVHCICETSRFDIDFHDRLFIPDIHRFCVQVLDSAGNQIALIGSYGNMDNRGPKSRHPQPAIAYGWPLATQVLGNRLYVADITNRRICAARLRCRVTETCAVR